MHALPRRLPAGPVVRLAVALALVALSVAAVGPGGARPAGGATAADPAVAPPAVLSPDGRSVTAGTMTLAAGQVGGLDPAGQVVQVVGTGYDVGKGIYVALCVVPPPNAVPGPCGGGVDVAGQAGAAQWVSSDPPAYGVGLATPFGPGGSFATSFGVRAEVAPGLDCRFVRCALVTRNDHTRTADRSQDLFLPVSFRSDPVPPATAAVPGAVPGAPSAGPVAGPAPVVTGPSGEVPTPPPTPPPPLPPPTAPPATTVPPRSVTVSGDGRTATDGTRSVTVSRVRDLTAGDRVTVSGSGFEPGRGVYVSLCGVAADPAAGPGPCAGGPGASVWLHSAPPPHGQGVAVPFGPDGSFQVQLAVEPQVDAATDCRRDRCAVTVRSDVADDRSLDLAVPVGLRDGAGAPAVAVGRRESEEAGGARETGTGVGGTGGGSPLVAGLLVVVAGSVAAGALLLRRRPGRVTP